MKRLAVVTGCGALAFTALEVLLSVVLYRGDLPFASAWRLGALAIALGSVWWMFLFVAGGVMHIAWPWLKRSRTWLLQQPPAMLAIVGAAASFGVVWRGHQWANHTFHEAVLTSAIVSAMAGSVAAVVAGFRQTPDAVARPLAAQPSATVHHDVPWLWSLLIITTASFIVTWRTDAMVSNAQWSTARIGVAIAAMAAVVATVGFLLLPALHEFVLTLGELLSRRLGSANPLGRRRAALLAFVVALSALLFIAHTMLPQVRSVLAGRDRMLISLGVTSFAIGQAMAHWPGAIRGPVGWPWVVVGIFVITVGALWRWGRDPIAKYAALTGSPMYERMIAVIRSANDFDRDGYGSLLGERDCAPFNSAIYPGARDMPDNGIDENCDGRDFSLRDLAAPPGEGMPVPALFARKDWNILLLTVDTVRYDHTSFGGYRDGPAKRDTTPELAKLVKRSTSFTFAQAPSAGTMASIPAILTSKFFHSGIALEMNGVTPGMPPRLTADNVTLPEIMKRGEYYTGVIGSHEYWNDWGLEQGVDSYDNSVGAKADPFRVVADKTSNQILSFMAAHQSQKWFLWAHYIDPHGRYVAHPDVVDWGSSEPDLYDAELRWTDQEIGRMLNQLAIIPGGDRTIVIVTSDHGESMGEHGISSGTHGTALYTELLHVPFIIYVPNNPPHLIDGAVSNLDIIPTIAELTGINVKDLAFEGRSLVPQLFYGKADPKRIVFAETNAPQPQRAAISDAYRYIYYLQNNVAEFYDLKADPRQLTNLAPAGAPPFAEYRDALNSWLERVVFSRDPKFNQMADKMADVLFKTRPTGFIATKGVSLDNGAIDVLGYRLADTTHLVPGSKVDILVYFEAKRVTNQKLKFGITVWPGSSIGADGNVVTTIDSNRALRVAPRVTIGGLFSTEHWRIGEFIRERFTITVPAYWAMATATVGLIAVTDGGQGVPRTGPLASNESNTSILGDLPVTVTVPAGSGAPPT